LVAAVRNLGRPLHSPPDFDPLLEPIGDARFVLHRAFGGDRLLVFDHEPRPPGSGVLKSSRGHRAIGVVYRPRFEHHGNYVPTVLPKRYDAFVYIEQSRALRPLHMEAREEGEVPETYPSGV
jgi:hypothetical protein